MGQRLRWGILGTGNIARQFCTGVNASARGVLAAVGSRSRESAEAFARQFGVPRAVGSYEDVLAERSVDAVYVSLPNHLHHEWTVRAVRAGKHVLCEKPFAVDAGQSAEMFDEAGRAGRLVMEAFMYRSHPLTRAVVAAVRGGAIGRLRLIRTSFCYRTTRVAENIRFNREMAGGALMDIGCYCVNFSRLFAGGEPVEIYGVGELHAGGVDEQASAVLKFPDEVLASFTCGMTLQADNTAYLCGTEGYIEVPVPWKPPVSGATYTLAHSTPPKMDGGAATLTGPPRQTFRVDGGRDLYAFEADDFAAAVLDGAPLPVSPADTLGNMRVLDELRRQVGVEFPRTTP
jgi:D-xylose 1-dehydrogenase (NADP+, D-xylono-1,5-lactone-forming)